MTQAVGFSAATTRYEQPQLTPMQHTAHVVCIISVSNWDWGKAGAFTKKNKKCAPAAKSTR